jgi:aminopeptidase
LSEDRIYKFARILTDYSAHIVPGDRVLLEGTLEALPLVSALYETILERGGLPYPMLDIPEQEELFFKYAKEEQLAHLPELRNYAYENFESRIRIHSVTNTRALSGADPKKQSQFGATTAPILATQMRRGAANEFKWVTTLFPTRAFAMEANMGYLDYADFVFNAVHAEDDDPIGYWQNVKAEQAKIIDRLEGHDQVKLRGPNVDLTLSIKDRKFLNACGEHNMPDGEVYTGPVETSVDGWVKYTYPAVYKGRVVEGVELTFVEGKVIDAKSKTNQDFLLSTLDSDAGSRYVGEFAIGTNYEIDRATGNILFDEKIGGSFHMALGAGYPETGSVSKSVIHWDMICDMREDAEIELDGEVVYKNGKFVF